MNERGPHGAQQVADAWLPHTVHASDLVAVGAVVHADRGPTPALLLGWSNPETSGDVLVVPPLLILDPQATLVTILEAGLRMAYDGEDRVRGEGVTVAERAADLAEPVVCAGSCGRRIFGVRADRGFCAECEPTLDS